jgi:hypothetical protein
MRGAKVAAIFPLTTALSQWWLRQLERPGKVATAARRKAVTSDNISHPLRQSHPLAVDLFLSILLNSLQYTFLLVLEEMSPGGLSTLLITTPYWRDTSRRVSWQVAMVTAAHKLRPNDDAARLPAVGQLLLVTEGRIRLLMAVDFKLCDLFWLNPTFCIIRPYL